MAAGAEEVYRWCFVCVSGSGGSGRDPYHIERSQNRSAGLLLGILHSIPSRVR